MLEQFKNIEKNELSMIEVAHAILEQKGDVMDFNDLIIAVQEYLQLSEDILNTRMSVFYTELNTDGSFISLGENRWGLRAWYPIDSIDEELISALEEPSPTRKKRKKVNAFDTSEDGIDYNSDDPEDSDELDDDELLPDEDNDDNYDINNSDDDDISDTLNNLSIISDEEAFENI